MIISWCIIVKDDSELDKLIGAVDSVIEAVDEIIITANGKDVDGIKKFCENEYYYTDRGKIKYFYHPWNKDFGEQRNFCASKIRKDADFYGWMDADDVLIGAHLLRKYATDAKRLGFDEVFFTYWYGCSFNGEPSADTVKDVEITQMRERLMKPGLYTWKKRIHETPVPIQNAETRYSQVKYSEATPIVWLHLGAVRDVDESKQKERMARNQELLELELSDERKESTADPRTLLYLMKIYAEKEEDKYHIENLSMGNEYMSKSGWDAERAICCSLMAKSLGKLGKYVDAKTFLHQSIREYPYDPLLYLYLSKTCFDLGQYREMKHWLEVALQMDSSKSFANMNNVLEMKALSSELLMQYYLHGDKNVRKAYKSMQLLYKELPTKENEDRLDYLEALKDLDEASENAHHLMLYYQDLNDSDGVVKIYESMPKNMKNLPFANAMYNKHKAPKVWAKDEICYYASYGRKHFEEWSPESLKKGIGGSETAVIMLAKEWAKRGWKVTVYCDCGLKEGEYDGVNYVNYFKFNPRDSFNIFINWRNNIWAGRIKAKKFIIDLHDLFSEEQFINYDQFDKLFVKSKFHRSLAEKVPDDKVITISNGI